MDSSEFLNFLATRVSVREYDGNCITEEDAEYLLSAASKAPSAGNLEAWDVVIVTDPGQLEMLSDAAGNQHQIKDSACVFCVCANYIRAMSRYGDRGIMFAVEDATIAATYMMLAAHARRLHTCWVGAFDDGEVKGILDLPPHIRPIALLCVGRGEAPSRGPERMDPSGHAHYDIWQAPIVPEESCRTIE